MQKPVRVCFVCLGNICRSPTAEAVFQSQVRAAGLEEQFVIDSAGTADFHIGKAADSRSRAHAERRGYELTSRARQFTAEDFGQWDYVLAMDEQNLKDLRALAPTGSTLAPTGSAQVGQTELRLFREFDPSAPAFSSVPDPYYGGEQGFEEVLDQCERAAAGFLEFLVKNKQISR